MIDFDRVRVLRDARLMTVALATMCIAAIIWPWGLVKDGLFALFAAYFVLRALDYTARIRELQLYVDDLHLRPRRHDTDQGG